MRVRRPRSPTRSPRCGWAPQRSWRAPAYTGFPPERWRRIRTNNGIERVNRDIRRRTCVVGTFPDGNSALMLATARLKYIAENEWGKRRYLNIAKLEEMGELRKAEEQKEKTED